MSHGPPVIEILVDADACPVKDEIYKVAARHGLRTFIVANAYINAPRDPMIERVAVPATPDAADDWIAARARPGAIVVTADIPLADRALKAGAEVIGPTGVPFTTASIGMALATRDLMRDLREAGETTRGPRGFAPRDRSTFLSALDLAINRLKRKGFGAAGAS